MMWELHPDVTIEVLGFLPEMLHELDPRSASRQFNERYAHGGGWRPQAGFKLNAKSLELQYPGDPPFRPIAKTKLRDETIILYDHEIVAIVQADGSFEACRMD